MRHVEARGGEGNEHEEKNERFETHDDHDDRDDDDDDDEMRIQCRCIIHDKSSLSLLLPRPKKCYILLM